MNGSVSKRIFRRIGAFLAALLAKQSQKQPRHHLDQVTSLKCSEILYNTPLNKPIRLF